MKLRDYLNEVKLPPKTSYVKWSSIFDNTSNKYDVELFMKALKAAGASKVWDDNQFGWSNQPKVVMFTGLDDKKAEDALDKLPVFKKWGAVVHDANDDWKEYGKK
jgi:hypothetical protein